MKFLKSDRIRHRNDFRRIQETGRKIHTKGFLIAILPSDRLRLGVTVSSRVGNSVRRNRIKRLVRETFRLHRDLFPETGDVVVIARSDCAVDHIDDVVLAMKNARMR